MIKELQKTGFLIIDDLIPKKDQDYIENYMFESRQELSFHITPYSSGDTMGKSEQVEEQMQLVSTLINLLAGKNTYSKVIGISGLYKVYENLFNKLGIDLLPNHILRSKINLQFKSITGNKNKFNNPHIDYTSTREEDLFPFHSLIYYINDNDGYTYLFDKKAYIAEDVDKVNIDKDLKVVKKIRSKKGRCVIFQGNIIHAGSNPLKSECRLVHNSVISL